MKSPFRPLLPLGLLLVALTPKYVRAQSSPPAALTTVHRFNGADGALPYAGLVLGADGNFYGATSTGVRDSANAGGTIFKLTFDGTLTTLHDAPASPPGYSTNEGGSQYRGELVQGSDGTFYGTAASGGTSGVGTVFKVTAAGVYTTLHNFARTDDGTAADGQTPFAALTAGRDGNFYGTTSNGGGREVGGTVFKITPDGVLTTLHRFNLASNSNDAFPYGKLVQGRDGNFYGTTHGGGSRYGTVFKITPAGDFTSLHTFDFVHDGALPSGGLAEGGDGNFYGTTSDAGSSSSFGTVFKITPGGVLTTLYEFSNGSDGAYPVGTLLLGRDGRFYGTTFSVSGATGTVFSITPDGQLTPLYAFKGTGDGGQPNGILAQAGDGTFYGTTAGGGTGGNGTIFRLTVASAPSHPAFFNGEAALGNGIYYLQFPGGNPFGYYSFLTDPHYIFHQDLGYEYVFEAGDGKDGVFLYDFKSGGFFYTSPSFPFPYLYDFSLNTVLYYFPDPKNPGRYNTDGVRYFVRLDTGAIISK